jgi:hypothetical protein
MRAWAMRRGYGGRPVRIEQAQGILVPTLGVLAGHHGYGEYWHPQAEIGSAGEETTGLAKEQTSSSRRERTGLRSC